MTHFMLPYVTRAAGRFGGVERVWRLGLPRYDSTRAVFILLSVASDVYLCVYLHICCLCMCVWWLQYGRVLRVEARLAWLF